MSTTLRNKLVPIGDIGVTGYLTKNTEITHTYTKDVSWTTYNFIEVAFTLFYDSSTFNVLLFRCGRHLLFIPQQKSNGVRFKDLVGEETEPIVRYFWAILVHNLCHVMIIR